MNRTVDIGRRQLLMIAAGCAAMKAQSRPEFEVASIKPTPTTGGMERTMRVGIQMSEGGRVTMSGVTVKLLLQQAYGVRDFQIVGGPAWMGTDRYDIAAKADGAATNEQMKLMLQSLLADRFKLQFRRETKELPTYALVVAKGGPKLTKSAESDAPDKPKGRGMMRMGRGMIDVKDVPIASLATQLSQVLGRSVIDKTELAGNYDYKLEWTPDEAQGGMFGRPEAHGEAHAESTGPTLFTALQEQLGLKLESTKGPVETMIIDGVEKPTEN